MTRARQNKNGCKILFLLFPLLILNGFFVIEIKCVRLLKIIIPAYRFRNENAMLECDFELDKVKNDDTYADEDLYSVKWYKDNEEFYRYVPRANPPQNSYKVDGIKVDHQSSTSKRVYLRALTLKSSGLYRCEVSAEGPNFSSVQGEGRLEIVYVPRGGPFIRGEETQYQIGDTLNLNCTSGKSHPPSVLNWFINNQPVLDPDYLINFPLKQDNHSLYISTLGLSLPIDGRHFKDGILLIRCVANFSPMVEGERANIVHRRPGMLDNREAILLVRSGVDTVRENKLNWILFSILLYALT